MTTPPDTPADDQPSPARPTPEPATADRGPSMPETRADHVRQGWLQRRQAKIRDEIDRNRRGDYTVPTWVYAVALVILVGAWIALIATA